MFKKDTYWPYKLRQEFGAQEMGPVLLRDRWQLLQCNGLSGGERTLGGINGNPQDLKQSQCRRWWKYMKESRV